MQEGTDRRVIILAVFALVAIGVVAAILISRSGGGGSDSTATAASAGGCKKVEEPKPKHVSLKAPKQTVKTGEKLTAVVRTSCGTFDIALDSPSGRRRRPTPSPTWPKQGFYNDLTFHRIVPGFVIQGGDPLGTGPGGPGYTVVEKPPANLSYTKGTVAMAKSSAEPSGSSGSQFYVVTGPTPACRPNTRWSARSARAMKL